MSFVKLFFILEKELINLLKEDDIKGILTEEQLEFMMILQPTDLKKDIEFMN